MTQANFIPSAYVGQTFLSASARLCQGKKFLNKGDAAYGPAMQAFLAERFPAKCKYER
jgi:hypothetical protein